jgi:pimeloyl-ACP methyl ester carboxylesterase
MIRHDITSADGTNLAVFEAGPTDAPPILLIHGWSQHHLSWAKQFGGRLPQQHRLIALDLRGHGASDKPDAADAYNHSQPWADDIKAVIDGLGLIRPLLVGWSMGGWVAQDYLRIHGADNIAGVALVGSSLTIGKHAPADVRARRDADLDVRALGMYSDNQAENLSATVNFVTACFAEEPTAADLAYMVGFNMMVPPHIREACRRRSEDYRPMWADLPNLPVQFYWGVRERIVLPPWVLEMRATLPHADVLPYSNCGHAPFWEDPQRFNTDLAGFSQNCQIRPKDPK